MPQAESHRRSLLKAVTWRAMGTLATAAIAFFITGTVEFAVKIGAADLFFKMFAYYVHERLWIYIPWGREKPIDYEI